MCNTLDVNHILQSLSLFCGILLPMRSRFFMLVSVRIGSKCFAAASTVDLHDYNDWMRLNASIWISDVTKPTATLQCLQLNESRHDVTCARHLKKWGNWNLKKIFWKLSNCNQSASSLDLDPENHLQVLDIPCSSMLEWNFRLNEHSFSWNIFCEVSLEYNF